MAKLMAIMLLRLSRGLTYVAEWFVDVADWIAPPAPRKRLHWLEEDDDLEVRE